MSKIDLSKAKIGDKFINKEGNVLEFFRFYTYSGCEYLYELKSKHGLSYSVTNDGSFIEGEENPLDLVKQVFDNEKDRATREREERINLDMEKFVRDIENEQKELQRRQEVLKYADMIFFNQKDTRIALFGYDVAIETAEIIVKSRDKYLKDGKLC